MNQKKLCSQNLILRMVCQLGFVILATVFTPLVFAEKPVVTLKSTVTGNQEQPKVLYIVPWKPNVGPETLYQNLNSQMSKVFAHVERQELQREIYFAQGATVKKHSANNE